VSEKWRNGLRVRVLFGLTLLLISKTRNIECQPTVDMESNENNFNEIHQINNLLLDFKKIVDRFEMRLEMVENRVLQETLQCSSNHTSMGKGKKIELNCRRTGKTRRHHVGLHSNVTQ